MSASFGTSKLTDIKKAVTDFQKAYDKDAIRPRVRAVGVKTAGAIIDASKPKPFLKWVGGKRQLVAELLQIDLRGLVGGHILQCRAALL